ncbi:hypothetical protein, partial [Phenylobacterium sp.]|uniref:hypothetical protein n=1 Tax=Phenylobacterium sp. TaxID=1871053 RepID=UPI002F3EBB17
MPPHASLLQRRRSVQGWSLLLQDQFAAFNVRTRGRAGGEGPFEQSWQEGTGLWTPRNHFFAGEDLGVFNNGEWA